MDLHPQRVRLRLAPEPSAPSRARLRLQDLDLPAGVSEPARLLASELVTNSVRHARAEAEAPISMTVDVRADRLRVCVEDAGHGDVRVEPQTTRRTGSGFGLFLVDEVSDRWGVSPTADGTRVWFELDAPATA
jgi:anti-sigma regulatory factor (Ser/Thr protein kinase)